MKRTFLALLAATLALGACATFDSADRQAGRQKQPAREPIFFPPPQVG